MMDLEVRQEEGVLTLAFNRPEKKNAITAAMYQTMADALTAAETDASVRVIVLTGKPEVFTAGNDLEDFMKHAAHFAQSDQLPSVYQFMQALNRCGKPVVAAVAGAAVGIGTTLLLHCDLVYLADNARLSMPFAQLGLCPEFASSLRLQQVSGYVRAAEKLLLGEAFDAQEACAMGLANRVVPLAELDAFAMQQARKLALLPPASVRTTKRLMKAGLLEAVQAQMNEENRHFATMLGAPEAREAFMAFFQKRKPDFSQFQ